MATPSSRTRLSWWLAFARRNGFVWSAAAVWIKEGPGTGKSVAYLVPAVAQGATVVVATATKALQEQLVGKDLPFLAEHLGLPFSFALLKGRGNYLCRAQLASLEGDRQQALDGLRQGDDDTIDEIVSWAAVTGSCTTSVIARPPTRTARASSFSRVPPQPGQSACTKYFW